MPSQEAVAFLNEASHRVEHKSDRESDNLSVNRMEKMISQK